MGAETAVKLSTGQGIPKIDCYHQDLGGMHAMVSPSKTPERTSLTNTLISDVLPLELLGNNFIWL